jgi:polyhydroxyalkanoate synthesis regulator phasin
MHETDQETEDAAKAGSGAEAVGDTLRNAVERTLAATAGSATETRDRAQGLLDDVVRRGPGAREQVARRSEEATTRLAEAIGDLRAADGEGLDQLTVRLAAIEDRLQAVETRLAANSDPQLEVEGIHADPDDQRDSGD